MKQMIAPSILAADFGRLNEEIEMVNNSEADMFHLDVMDGVFVPNISFGIPVIQAINEKANKPLDVHLMIVQPERYIADFNNAGANILTVHYEVCNHLHRIIYSIKDHAMQAGVALNPHSPVNLLKDVICDIDLVCLMSVNPGFGGQKFIPNTLDKIRELKKMILDNNSNAKIEIDGGVGVNNAQEILNAGADILVAGSSVFKADDPVETISSLKNIELHTLKA